MSRSTLRSLVRRPVPARRVAIVALGVAAVAALASADFGNQAAACRGAGTVSLGAGGTIVTTWPDGARIVEKPDGSYAWSRPAGSPPLPGTSPGHPPNP